MVQGFTVSPAHSLPLLLCPALRVHRLCLVIGNQYTFLDMSRLNMAAVLSHVTRHFRYILTFVYSEYKVVTSVDVKCLSYHISLFLCYHWFLFFNLYQIFFTFIVLKTFFFNLLFIFALDCIISFLFPNCLVVLEMFFRIIYRVSSNKYDGSSNTRRGNNNEWASVKSNGIH